MNNSVAFLTKSFFLFTCFLLITELQAWQQASFNVLVFSKTSGYRHQSIEDGHSMISLLGEQHNFDVTVTENAAVFSAEGLAPYDVVVFLCTTGDVLNGNQQASFENFIRSGKGYVGIHSAADTEYGWSWYGELMGAYFQSHPAIQPAVIKVADRFHTSTKHLPERWQRTDEWYNFQQNPRGDVHVLATIDESSYSGGEDGHDHPVSWCHPYDGGRAWYTALGHTSASYTEPAFMQHVLGGILYAAGKTSADDGATIEENYSKQVLDDNILQPMEVAVSPDGRVFFIERGGALKIFLPQENNTVLAGEIDVTGRMDNDNDGLLGLALDPSFSQNNWLYLYYSPAGDSVQNLSRFTMDGNMLDGASERVLLQIPVVANSCCHSGGSLAFGPEGRLFISTGDDTSPFESDGFNPIDEREGRAAFDAQRTSGNSMDLRGKILRITPLAEGSYSVPEDNLFAADDTTGRPEIYIMGCRNPFRISVDQQTGRLYWGDVGPDSNTDNAGRGPRGYDEWNRASQAGNYGWPYFIADNKPYTDYDFSSGESGSPFDSENVVNDSPNNTGAEMLPVPRPAWIWYPYAVSEEFPQFPVQPGGRTTMAGPVYHWDSLLVSETKLPAYFDRTLFVYDWSRRYIFEVKLDNAGDILTINPFLPGFEFARPIDLELGPDGSLYLLEWGSEYSGGGADASLVRLEYTYTPAGPTSINEKGHNAVPDRIVLHEAWPNPFNPETRLSFTLPEKMTVKLEIFDVLGRPKEILVDETLQAGFHSFAFNGRQLSSGIYIYRLTSPGYSTARKMLLVK